MSTKSLRAKLGDDPALYLVYADALLEEGADDPHAQLIIAQVNGDEARAAAILEEHADALLGELSDGFAATWRWGFIDEARFGVEEPCWMERGFAMRALFRLRTAKRLRSLVLGDFGDEDEDYEDADTFEDYERAIERLGRVKVPPTFRRLAFRPTRMPLENVTVGDLGPALRNLPMLEELVVWGSDISLVGTDVTLSSLRRLELVGDPLAPLLEALLDPTRFVALEELDVSRADVYPRYLEQLRERFGPRLRER